MAVLGAPPGAGKTTRVPLALLTAPWLAGRILLLEPRRLAARATARFLARHFDEPVGRTVGLSTREDQLRGPHTRLEVVTEGILIRRLQQDPALEEVGLVIFDEFHERNLQADLGLALCLQARSLLRADLRLLVMSATLESDRVAAWLEGSAVLHSQGRQHPVTIEYRGAPSDPARPAAAVVRAVREALRAHVGDLLVFLPGMADIARVQAALQAEVPPGVEITPLHGQLPPPAQDRAIHPAPAGRRKVVLATDIAETSLTIEGIRVVIDAGLARRPRFDPRTGLTRLETQRIAQANATQRCGRAGRLGPGHCVRLWSESEHARLAAQPVPEILDADLAPLALTLACWGAEAEELCWLDPPPDAALAQGRDLLVRLGALDAQGRVTAHGRALERFGTHPRLAQMLLAGREMGLAATGALLAAVLEESDPLDRGRAGCDLRDRLVALADPGGPVHPGSRRRLHEQARRWCRMLGAPPVGPIEPDAAGRLLAQAYPDRIALRRAGHEPRFLLANGRGATLPGADPLAAEDCIVAAVLDGGEREARIHLAASLSRDRLEADLAAQILEQPRLEWDAQAGAVRLRRERRLGALLLAQRPWLDPPAEAVREALLAGILRQGLACLPWSDAARRFQQRVVFARTLQPADWPDLSDAALSTTLAEWLGPWLDGKSRLSHLQDLDLEALLQTRLDWDQRRCLDAIAPAQIQVPSGARLRIDYSTPHRPVLQVRIQEVFGWTDTPRIGAGEVALTLHLLSPARRPVQVTTDLAGFWVRTYPEVRKDLKGRYPKHRWPEDPR